MWSATRPRHSPGRLSTGLAQEILDPSLSQANLKVTGMSFLAWVVKAILNALDLDVPWRTVGTAMVAVLVVVAYTDRSDFIAGVHAWTVDAACRADQEMVGVLLVDKQLPRMTVARVGGACIVQVSQPTSSGPNLSPGPEVRQFAGLARRSRTGQQGMNPAPHIGLQASRPLDEAPQLQELESEWSMATSTEASEGRLLGYRSAVEAPSH